MSGTDCSMSLTLSGEHTHSIEFLASIYTTPIPYPTFVLQRFSNMCSVNLGDKGMEALITLGAGDMRRTLNILQVMTDGMP